MKPIGKLKTLSSVDDAGSSELVRLATETTEIPLALNRCMAYL